MNERMPSNQNKQPVEIEGVSFPDYTIKKGSSVLVPKPPSRAEILRKEPNIEADKSFQAEKVAVATRLVERCEFGEVFPFPGLRPERYEAMKRDWEEEPGYATDVDELLGRFEREGMKVVFTNDPTSGNVLLMPSLSNDPVSDSLMPRSILSEDILDDTLRDMVLMEHFHYLQK